jgi:hypothetical protein
MNDEEVGEIDVELIKKKVLAHHQKRLRTHLVFKKGYWKNGLVTEIGAEFFMLDELFEGTMPVFYSELSKVETYNSLNKKGAQ